MSLLTDVMIGGGPVFDGRQVLPEGTWIGVVDGHIADIGTADDVRETVGPAAERLDLHGRLLHPGFTDAHIHALSAGVDRNGCDVSDVDGRAETLAAIAAYARTSDRPWIVGSGWSMADFPGGCPTAAELDTILPDRPAFLLNRDHHGAWVNTAALTLAGIDAQTPDPIDGRIERDAAGVAVGTLHEGAMDLVSRLVPPTTFDEALAGLRTAQSYLHGFGITGWQEAIVGDYPGMTDLAAAYRSAEASGELTATVVGASWLPRPTTLAAVPEVVAGFVAAARAADGPRWSARSVKIMVDGVVENRTALMGEPYVGSCSCAPEYGLGYFDDEILRAAVVACDGAGLDVHFHAIGDAAVTAALDAVTTARRVNGITPGRHHIAHLQFVRPADLPRFARLGVTANMQALWACVEDQLTELVAPIVGPERMGWHYPFASIEAAGADLAMGSDWPVSSPDPWAAISVAVNRVEPGLDPATTAPLVGSEALTLRSCLTAYTHGSAVLNRRRNGGLLRIGSSADFAVADRDPFLLEPKDLYDVRTDLTVAEGRVVHERTR
ncbi:amidohydrolase [Millisia brevis]|uniref:amidohydrolase n=1 Tax=Millisia brevis TaxID=264148 RepID=UPI000A42467F|nr:amidohydrolase [Millisia brevis]